MKVKYLLSELIMQCKSYIHELGMNLTTAINVFLRQSLRVGGFPFDVKLDRPNNETIAAMQWTFPALQQGF